MDVSYYVDQCNNWRIKLQKVSKFDELPDGLSFVVHLHSSDFSIGFRADKVEGLELLHSARSWLKNNLGTWEDGVMGIAKFGDTVHINFGNDNSDFDITWMTEDPEVVSMYVSPGCEFVESHTSSYKRLTCPV